MLAGTLLLQHRKNVDREQRKAEAIAALERVPTVTPTPAATPTPTPTPIPTATPTPVLERAYVFNPEDYLGTWRSKNGRVKIKIKKLSQKSVTFTYSQTNKKKTATTELCRHNPVMLINEEDWTVHKKQGVAALSFDITPIKGLKYTPSFSITGL